MTANKYIGIDSNGNMVELTGISTSAGAGDAYKLLATNSLGQVDPSFMPTGYGIDTVSMVCSEALASGAWVNIYDNGGIKNARNANATDATKPCCGFVVSAFSLGATALVYVRGLNTAVPIGSMVVTNIGSKAFLDWVTPGGTSTAPPTATGNYLQVVGTIDDVNTVSNLVTVNFSYNPGTTRA